MALVVLVALQDPGGRLPATVGEGDPVELVLDYRGAFAGGLHGLQPVPGGALAGRADGGGCGVVDAGAGGSGGGYGGGVAGRGGLRVVLPAPVLEAKQDTQHDEHHQHERTVVLATTVGAGTRVGITNLGQGDSYLGAPAQKEENRAETLLSW